MIKESIMRVLMLMFAFALLSSSCSKDEESSPGTSTNKEESNNSTITNNTSNDNYYVKYEVLNGKQVGNGTKTVRTISFKDVNRSVTVEVTYLPWEGTYGPFKKGEKVYMTLSSSGAFSSTCRLSVSKNREAFAIKKEMISATSGSLEYTIDY